MSSSVLYDRLRELSEASLVVKGDDGSYELSPLGERLGAALAPLDAWAREWAQDHSEP